MSKRIMHIMLVCVALAIAGAQGAPPWPACCHPLDRAATCRTGRRARLDAHMALHHSTDTLYDMIAPPHARDMHNVSRVGSQDHPAATTPPAAAPHCRRASAAAVPCVWCFSERQRRCHRRRLSDVPGGRNSHLLCAVLWQWHCRGRCAGCGLWKCSDCRDGDRRGCWTGCGRVRARLRCARTRFRSPNVAHYAQDLTITGSHCASNPPPTLPFNLA